MRKYWGFLRNTITSAIEYRGEFIGGITLNLISISEGLVFWFAVYQSNSAVGNYRFNDIVFYYLFMPIIGAFTYVTASERLPKQIKDGKLSTHLLKPYKLWISTIMETIGGKIIYISVIFPIYFLIYQLLSVYFEVGIANLEIVVVIVIGALILHYFMDIAICWMAFWLDDVWSFRHFKNIVLTILGGSGFPLDLLPEHVKPIVNLLPFQYLFYIPISYLTGKRNPSFLAGDLVGLVLWSVVFILIGNLLWKIGLKKFEAYGN